MSKIHKMARKATDLRHTALTKAFDGRRTLENRNKYSMINEGHAAIVRFLLIELRAE